jgi:DNA-binding SARP family transcriptional activator
VARVKFGVLGPVEAWDAEGAPLDLKGPRHRAVLARLAVAHGRVVPLHVLIEDLWETPPAGATGAIRTFVGALRRAVAPVGPPRGGVPGAAAAGGVPGSGDPGAGIRAAG